MRTTTQGVSISRRPYRFPKTAEASSLPLKSTTTQAPSSRGVSRHHSYNRQIQRKPLPSYDVDSGTALAKCFCQLPVVFAVVSLVFGFGSILGLNWLLGPIEDYGGASRTPDGGPKNEEVAVFYHIYIPPNKGKKGFERTRDIVQEQISQIGMAAKAYGKQWTVRYTTSGESVRQKLVTHRWIEQKACRKHAPFLRCIATGPHRETGHEEITLQAMYKYCHRHGHHSQKIGNRLTFHAMATNVSSRLLQSNNIHHHLSTKTRIVIYLHSKGTFHSAGGRNDIWRQALTHAATHSTCLSSLHHNYTDGNFSHNSNQTETTRRRSNLCNVCGLQFYPLWTTFFPGNMFAADCAYVRRLLDPMDEFPQRLARVVQHVNQSASSSSRSLQWTHDLYNFNRPGNTGLDRYASEHWIASHPLIRPCDVQGNNTALFSERLPERIPESDTESSIFSRATLSSPWWSSADPIMAQPAPRVAIEHGNWFRLNLTQLKHIILPDTTAVEASLQEDAAIGAEGSKKEEYFLLPGLLYRHHEIYGAYPPRDSWIWKWYPRGQLWFEKIHGSNSHGEQKRLSGSVVDW